ncbi:hypothetical protein NKH77_38885 [Streptomyces sp. M19]
MDELHARMVTALCDAVPRSPASWPGCPSGRRWTTAPGSCTPRRRCGRAQRPFDLLGALRARRPDVGWHVVNDVTAALLHAASAPGAPRTARCSWRR